MGATSSRDVSSSARYFHGIAHENEIENRGAKDLDWEFFLHDAVGQTSSCDSFEECMNALVGFLAQKSGEAERVVWQQVEQLKKACEVKANEVVLKHPDVDLDDAKFIASFTAEVPKIYAHTRSSMRDGRTESELGMPQLSEDIKMVLPYYKRLHQALLNLPRRFKIGGGLVYRGMKFRFEPKAIQQRFHVGSEVTFFEPRSASSQADVSQGFADYGGTILEIASSTGYLIKEFSFSYYEYEVLMPMFSKFKVTGLTPGEKQDKVQMQQLPAIPLAFRCRLSGQMMETPVTYNGMAYEKDSLKSLKSVDGPVRAVVNKPLQRALEVYRDEGHCFSRKYMECLLCPIGKGLMDIPVTDSLGSHQETYNQVHQLEYQRRYGEVTIYKQPAKFEVNHPLRRAIIDFKLHCRRDAQSEKMDDPLPPQTVQKSIVFDLHESMSQFDRHAACYIVCYCPNENCPVLTQGRELDMTLPGQRHNIGRLQNDLNCLVCHGLCEPREIHSFGVTWSLQRSWVDPRDRSASKKRGISDEEVCTDVKHSCQKLLVPEGAHLSFAELVATGVAP